MLTSDQVEEYLESGYNRCPKCKSREISTETPDIDGRYVEVEAMCDACEFKWIDIYRLTGIEEL